ncbi:MAG: disulfide bond formation protein B [Anaplasmataceae bacterium]|nr:disulfide bond formation protein B [Anaplasmataceae bacterium]
MQNRLINFILSISSSCGLVSAFCIEVFFDVKPCMLCSYERIIYATILVIGSFFTFEKMQTFVVKTQLLCFFILIVLSFYHIGLEIGFISEKYQICSVFNNGLNNSINVEKLKIMDLMNDFKEKSSLSCSKPSFIFDKFISIAMLNFVYCSIISILCLLVYKFCEKEKF